MIVAHLDLDAFFAAVEELEEPSLRSKPLVVGRRSARPRRRRDRELRGAALRHPLGDELRRGAPPLPAGRLRAARGTRSTATTRGPSGAAVREVVPTVERTGSTRATSTSARWRSFAEAARGRGRGAGRRARGDQPDLRDRRRRRARSSPRSASDAAQARRADRRAGRAARPRSSRRSRCGSCRESAPGPRSGSHAAGIGTVGRSRRSTTTRCGCCSRGRSDGCSATGPAESIRGGSRRRSRRCRSRPRRPSSTTSRPRGAARRAQAHGRAAWPGTCARARGRTHGHDEGALPGLRDPQPLGHAAGRHRRRRDGSASSRARSSTAPWPTGPARCGSSGSASRASRPTASSFSAR